MLLAIYPSKSITTVIELANFMYCLSMTVIELAIFTIFIEDSGLECQESVFIDDLRHIFKSQSL